MRVPKIGDVVTTEYGSGVVEHVYYRVTYPGGGPSFHLCTVKLDTPFKDRKERVVTRIEAEVPIEQEQMV